MTRRPLASPGGEVRPLHLALPLLLALLCAPPLGAAEHLLLTLMERATPTPDDLARAREQIENPPAEPLKEPLFVPPFHERPRWTAPPATLCHGCHGTSPHRKDPLKRAYLNAHARHIACVTCHWRPKTRPVEYRRLPTTGDGPPGLIAPWVAGAPLTVPESDPAALQLQQRWNEGDPRARIHLKAKIHQPLEREGPACTRCHQKRDPLLDLESLGYDAARARELLLHPVPQFVERSEPHRPGAEPRRIQIRELLE